MEKAPSGIADVVDVDPGEWESLLDRDPRASIFHTSAWRAAVEDAHGHIRARFLGLRDERSGELLGGLPVYAVPSWLLGNRLLGIPFGTFGDPLLDRVKDVRRLQPALEALRQETKASDVRIRVRDRLPVLEQIGFEPCPEHWHHFLPIGEDPGKLKKGFSRTNVRQWIQRAERAGLTTERCSGEAAMKLFYPMFVYTRKRLGLPWVPYRFFEALHRHLGPDKLSLFMARRGEKTIAGVMTLCFKDMLILETLGESASASRSGAMQLIYWAAIQWASTHGYRHVSFGQTEKRNEGLARHKRSWGCVEEDLADYHLVTGVSSSRSGGAGGVVKAWLRPLIRRAPVSFGTMLSRFIYRHWA